MAAENDQLPDSREDSIRLVKQLHHDVLKEIGPEMAPFVNRKKICGMIHERLPLKPIYNLQTVYLIVNGTYK